MHAKGLAWSLAHSRGSITGSVTPPKLWIRFWGERRGSSPNPAGVHKVVSLPSSRHTLPSYTSLTLYPQALLILDDEVLLSLLQLLQLILCVLCDQSQLLKCLVDLKVFLGHGINQDPRRRTTLETYQGRVWAAVSWAVRMGENLRPWGTPILQTPNARSRIRRKGTLS